VARPTSITQLPSASVALQRIDPVINDDNRPCARRPPKARGSWVMSSVEPLIARLLNLLQAVRQRAAEALGSWVMLCCEPLIAALTMTQGRAPEMPTEALGQLRCSCWSSHSRRLST